MLVIHDTNMSELDDLAFVSVTRIVAMRFNGKNHFDSWIYAGGGGGEKSVCRKRGPGRRYFLLRGLE